MQIKAKGLVIKQKNIGNTDVAFTILTVEYGVIEATVHNAKTAKNKIANTTQILSYNEFCFFKGKSNYIINSSDPIEAFYSLRLDVSKLALAGYFCELIHMMCKENDDNSAIYMKLILNTLFFLQKNEKNPELLKSIFELRSMEICGFMPNLVACKNCGEYENSAMYFLPIQGEIVCKKCFEQLNNEKIIKFTLPQTVLTAMRHIIFSEIEKLFSFNLNGDSLKQLNFITENYIFLHLDAKFNSLEMYKMLK
ncbi:MAG: DNA repair protein RecO [Oscillospiraceae bacterium]